MHIRKQSLSRREFLCGWGAGILGSLFVPTLLQAHSRVESGLSDHPRIFLGHNDSVPGLRSIKELREEITKGHSRRLWQRLLEHSKPLLGTPPFYPGTQIPGRSPDQAKHENRDYTICLAAGQRVLRHALISVLLDDSEYREDALKQMSALFDADRWPAWIDKSHLYMGFPADLRTGMLSRDVAVAYDWLYPSLDAPQRRRVVDGLDRCGIQPFLQSVEMDPWWLYRNINWLTVIVGGLGIAGMALGKDHPQSQKLIDLSMPLMTGYLDIYGEKGEFNESVAYSNATELPVAYFKAAYDTSGGRTNRLARRPFPPTCRWLMYMTLPPGRVAAFGDAHVDAVPRTRFVAAVAGATKDGVLQQFYLDHSQGDMVTPEELLWYDPSVPLEPPQDHLPLAAIFPEQGGCFSSRSSWDPERTPSVVYGKTGREDNHEHNDVGQLCIDGYGDRLIVDLGSPSSYPADFFSENRWAYYNASIRGHNVLMFDGQEPRMDRDARARIIDFTADDRRGASCCLDLTAVYPEVQSVGRTIIHLLPGVVAVLDTARRSQPAEISLRWHTVTSCLPDAEGRFWVVGPNSRLASRLISLDTEPVTPRRGEHRYHPPHDLNRLGEPLEPRRESYVELNRTAEQIRWLSLFCVYPKTRSVDQWTKNGDGYDITGPDGTSRVELTDNILRVRNVESGVEIESVIF
jgi:hypothetical protein